MANFDWVAKAADEIAEQRCHSAQFIYNILIKHCPVTLGEVEQLRNGIREHRDAVGDDRCWRDDEALYSLLPEGYVPPVRDTAVELARCQQYIACRHNPATTYISPQRRIEELESTLRTVIQAVAQGEAILGRRQL